MSVNNFKPKENPSHQNLESILQIQDNAALIKTLLEYAEQDEHVKQDLLFRFAKKDKDSAEYARNLITTSIKRVMKRGFVEYRDAKKAVEGANKILEMAESMTDDILSRISLCSVILEEMEELFNACDNSVEVDIVNASTVGLIIETVETIPDDFSDIDKVLDLLFIHVNKAAFDGFDWKTDLRNAVRSLEARKQTG
jgi:hypothetical protein